MRVMKWGFLLITLFTGPVGACVYVLSCKPPTPTEHAQFVSPLWKQAVGSTVHCIAGDATGIIAAAAVTMALGLVMWHDIIAEYVFGFAFGLLIFQALFMKQMLGGSYLAAVRKSFLPEWLSMNVVMAGMIPVMVVLMSRDMTSMHLASLRFWGVMSLATMVGSACSYPVNYWLVAVGLKHGMGTVLALGDGGHSVSAETGDTKQQSAMPSGHAMRGDRAMPSSRASGHGSLARTTPELRETVHQLPGTIASSGAQRVAVTLLTILALAGGVLIAGMGGDLAMSGNASMRRDAGGMEMRM
ncbi:MAG: DUF4396 domain-containing protein [Gemmatimonadaceae bacterium]|nr:DUF4396 domain-containing protein [Gemmatimonadaceae bacterium]